MAHVVNHPNYGSDPPGMALSRPNAQEYRCARDGPISRPGGSSWLVTAKRSHLAHSVIPAHLVVTGPSRADWNRGWDEL